MLGLFDDPCFEKFGRNILLWEKYLLYSYIINSGGIFP